MDEKYKFDFLDFHLSAVIGKDGATKKFTVDKAQVYVPKKLKAQMQVLGKDCPNRTINELFFKKKT